MGYPMNLLACVERISRAGTYSEQYTNLAYPNSTFLMRYLSMNIQEHLNSDSLGGSPSCRIGATLYRASYASRGEAAEQASSPIRVTIVAAKACVDDIVDCDRLLSKTSFPVVFNIRLPSHGAGRQAAQCRAIASF